MNYMHISTLLSNRALNKNKPFRGFIFMGRGRGRGVVISWSKLAGIAAQKAKSWGIFLAFL